MEIEKLDWDSNLFGYEVGKISIESDDVNLDDILSINKNNFKLLYVASNEPLDSREFGSCYAKITFSKKVEGDKTIGIKKRDLITEQYSGKLTDQLLNLTYQSGAYSRFNLDENFDKNEYKKLYKKWIENSLNRKIADIVEVVKDNNSKILGLVTIKFETNVSEVGLIAVDDDARGLGLGSLLVQKVRDLSINKECEKIFVSTQKDNKLACKFYEKNGFKEYETKYIYHWWTNK